MTGPSGDICAAMSGRLTADADVRWVPGDRPYRRSRKRSRFAVGYHALAESSKGWSTSGHWLASRLRRGGVGGRGIRQGGHVLKRSVRLGLSVSPDGKSGALSWDAWIRHFG